MNVPTPDDVFEAVKARLEAEAGYPAFVTGGTHYQRRPGNKVFPYTVGTVAEQPPLLTQSDGSYVQGYVVELSVWCESADNAAAATGQARNLLDNALGWKPADPANGLALPNAVRTLHVRPAGGSLRLSPELRKGQDVLAAGKRVEVLVQGQR